MNNFILKSDLYHQILYLKTINWLNSVYYITIPPQELRSQVPMQEYNVKQLSQLAQAMVKHLNKEQATGLLTTLRALKDRLVTVRDTIPVKAKVIAEALPVVHQYEEGLEEVKEWMEEAENMVCETDSVPSDRKDRQKMLRKHKVMAG